MKSMLSATVVAIILGRMKLSLYKELVGGKDEMVKGAQWQ